MSVFEEMRSALVTDLKPNELKAWMAYRLEMDEATRQVRGKTQADLCAVAGISRSQFSAASASLEKRGFIVVQKTPNACNLVSVNRMSEIPTSETRTSRNSDIGHPETRTSACPESGQPLYIDSRSTALKSAPVRASARGDDQTPDHVKPIANWSQAFPRQDDNHGVLLTDGALILVNGTRQFWLDRFDGDAKALDLALIAAAGQIQPNSRTHTLKAQVERHLARAAGDRHDRNQRYAAAAAAKGKPAKPSKSADMVQVFNRLTGEIEWRKREVPINA